MTLNVAGLQTYLSIMQTMVERMGDLPQPITGGRAAALGTLTAMSRRLELLVAATKTRGLTDVDRKDLGRDEMNHRWLRETDWIYEQFDGVAFPLNGGSVTYAEAMIALVDAFNDALKPAD